MQEGSTQSYQATDWYAETQKWWNVANMQKRTIHTLKEEVKTLKELHRIPRRSSFWRVFKYAVQCLISKK